MVYINDERKGILGESLFFTGAGFSKPAGCKLSGEMLKDLENKSNDENSNLFLKSERKAIKFILSCLDYQARYRTLESNGKYTYSPNIEEFAQLLRRIKNRENLLPYPVTGNWSDKITTIEQDFKTENKNRELDIWSSIEEKIKRNCYPEWLNINNENINYLEPLKNLLQALNSDTKIEIFTLNNDLVIETFFNNENSIYTGFVSNKWVGFEKENIDNDTLNASRVNFYKLHGSLDWCRLTDGTIKKRMNENIDEGNIELQPFLIFGHGTKIYTIDPFFSLLEHFKNALKKKKYFFVIGYSFFDPHINNLIFNELASSADKLLIIINPKIADDISENDYEEKNGIKKVLKREAKQKLVDFFSNIQQNPIYTELPDFNIKKISSDVFEYVSVEVSDFLKNIESYIDFAEKIASQYKDETNLF